MDAQPSLRVLESSALKRSYSREVCLEGHICEKES